MSTRDKKLLIVLAGVVVLALSYIFVYQKQADTKAELEAQNMELQAKYNELWEKAQMADQYKQDTDEMNAKVDELLKEYPSLLKIENVIMDVVNLEEKAEASITGLSIADAVAVVVEAPAQEATNETGDGSEAATDSGETAGEAEATDSGDATGEAMTDSTLTTQLYEISTGIDFTGNTKSLKTLISEIVDAKNKQSINSLTIAFDSNTGKISGSLNYNSYFLYGLEKPYEEPYIPSMKHGLDDIFGTGSGKE